MVSEHLEEVEHPLPDVTLKGEEAVEGPERVEGEDREPIAVSLLVVDDHLLQECYIVRLVILLHDLVNLPQVGEVRKLHLQGDFDPKALHVLQMGMHRFL